MKYFLSNKRNKVIILVSIIVIITGITSLFILMNNKEELSKSNDSPSTTTSEPVSEESSSKENETEENNVESEPTTPAKGETPTRPSTGVTPTKPTKPEKPVERPAEKPIEPTKPVEEPKEDPKPEEPTTCNRTSSRPDRIAYLEIPCGEDPTKYMSIAKSKMDDLLDTNWDEDYACYAYYGDENCSGGLSSPGYIYSTDNKKIGIYIEFTMYHDTDNDGVADETVGKGYITPDGKIKYSWKNY